MATEIKVPSLGESVTEATVASWFKSEGDAVDADETVCELETDKVTLEVNAPAGGVLKEIKAKEGDTVEIDHVLGVIEEGASASSDKKDKDEKKDKEDNKEDNKEEKDEAAPAPSPEPAPAPAPASQDDSREPPSVKKIAAEKGLDLSQVPASGKDGRHTKGDVIGADASGMASPKPEGPREERVKMSKLRQVIAKRLKDSQNTAAILTTFNEIDMSAVMDLRKAYKEDFEKKFGIKLGFMGFFVKAAVHALKEIPAVNAEIDGTDVVYKNHYDIGVAVGTKNGLVVPVVRDADQLSLAEVEGEIMRLAGKARDGSLSMGDMSGGTFTVSNGGVYGSLMSTPIINPPQSGILGMHKTEQRPVVVDGQIVIRPMMYVALSYDHRIIDGKESVTFLVKIKEAIEDPRRLLLGL